MSKKITLAAGTARFDHGITKENGELFKERVDYVLNAYSELLSGQRKCIFTRHRFELPKIIGLLQPYSFCQN